MKTIVIATAFIIAVHPGIAGPLDNNRGEPLASDGVKFQTAQPWKAKIVMGGRVVGLTGLISIDGDVARFSIYQGEPVKLPWSKLPAGVQQAFAADREKLITPPTQKKTLREAFAESGAKGIFGRVIRKTPNGLLVMMERLTTPIQFTFYGTETLSVSYSELEMAGNVGQMVLLKGLPNEASLVDDDDVAVVGFFQGVWESDGQSMRVFSATPAASK